MHSLVVGGTGMLRGLSIHLATRGPVTVLARPKHRLQLLSAKANVHAAPADWTDPVDVMRQLEQAVASRGPFEQAVIWIHRDGRESLYAMVPWLVEQGCHTVWVRGLASVAPEAKASRYSAVDLVSEVTLGFIHRDGRSRWLRHEEIVAGIRAGLELRLPLAVGHVRPWASRPREE